MGNKIYRIYKEHKLKKERKMIKKYVCKMKRENKRNKRPKKYPLKPNAVKVTVYDGFGNIRYDITPKYSYVYNGVPGGWFI